MLHRHRPPHRSWLYLFAAVALAGFATPAAAQVVPDATLGNGNNSTTLINGIRTDINGGLRRNSALFHSFERFGILTNHQVYFANPAGIRNIFSRVTGGNISNIDGLLGVSGGANLFFMNPNGIIFGPNARLDVSGSFLATTANVLQFADGQKFAATGDLAVPLVEVNIPIGLQFGANPPAMLTNRGILAAGQDLTLASNNLDLQGQLQAGGNLTLNATDTVKIRDTVTEPFVARSGGDMMIQGDRGVDILALNHPTATPFVSGGNLSLISDGIISGDAHYASGGTFQIKSISGQPANFLSLYDPVISSAGDIDISGAYDGPALLVESLGNIRFQGNVNITGSDPAFANNANTDLATLGSSAALIVRANRNALAFAPPIALLVPPTRNLSGAAFQAGAVPAGITIGGGITTNAGPVILEAVGPINLGAASGFSAFASSIAIDTNGALTASGILSVRRDGPQRAGNIVIGNNGNSNSSINEPGSRQPSSVIVGAISTRNITDIADDTNGDGIINNIDNLGGGDITVKTTGAFSTTGAFGAVSGQPVVLTDPDAFSIASESNAGGSGNISIISTGGLVNLANRRVSSASNFNGQGGNITLEGTSVDTSGGVIRSLNDGTVIAGVPATGFTSTDASGGNVTLRATAGNISAGSINATSRNNNSANSYSAINLTATASSANPINTGLVLIDQATLSTSNLGNYYAGDIIITATNQINITGNTTRNSILRSDGYFGVVDLRTTGTNPNPNRQILIQDSQITAAIPDTTGVATTILPDGSININSPLVRIERSTIDTKVSAPPLPLPPPDRQANAGNITVQGNVIQIVDNSIFETITNDRVIGNSGDISIGSTFNTSSIELENSRFSTSANGQGNSGNIRVAANQSITATGGSIGTTATGTNANGVAGNVEIISNASNGQAIQLTNLGIDAAAFGTGGTTGSVTISAPNRGDVSLIGNRAIFTDTFGNQPTGDSTIFGGNILIDQYRLNASVNTSGVTGGNVWIDGTSVTMRNGSTIRTETVGGRSGDIRVRATTGDLTFAGGAIRTTVNANATGNGGDITLVSNGGQIEFSNGFQVNAATNTTNPLAASGRGGDVSITSNGGLITVGGGTAIDARTTGTQAGGKVEILSGGGTLSVLNSTVNASTSGSSSGGDVSLRSAGGNLNFNGGDVSTESRGLAGNGGDITIASNGGQVTFSNGSKVNSATSSQAAGGRGGDVSITSSGGLIDINGNSAIDAQATGSQAGGKVEILSGGGALSVLNSTVNASTSGSSNGGDVSLRSGGGNLNFNGGGVSTASSGLAGNGGDITIASNGGQVTFSGEFKVNSATSSQVAAGGRGGDVSITSSGGLIAVNGDSAIDASTSGTQTGGTVSVFSGNQRIQLNSGSIRTTVQSGASGEGGAIQIQSNGNDITLGSASGTFEINAATAVNSSGRGGSVSILSNGGQISVFNNSIINASTEGAKPGGTVSLASSGGSINLSSGTVATTVGSQAAGNGGDVTITSNGGAITFGNPAANTGFEVNAQTQATNTTGSAQTNGKGGNVAISSGTGDISLVANSTITAGSTGTKDSGIVTLTGNNIALANSQISTSSSGSGNAGDITATGRNINLSASQIQASSSGSGGSGDVTVTGADMNLIGGARRSAISTSAEGENASAGNVTLNAIGRTITLQNSDVLASSLQGTSGNINITARRLDLKNGTIKAEIGKNTASQSGSIKLDVSFRLTLENESEISTLGRNGANGGDISILNVRFLFGRRATGANGSDIVGRAEGGGRGGRVFLDRSTLVQGFLFRRAVAGNRTNDIDTNGQLDNFSTNADEGTRGLSKPLIIFSDVTQITNSACEAVGAKSAINSELRIAGRGGVASSPTAPLAAQTTTSDWVSLELSPQVPVQVTLPDGKPMTLEPSHSYQLQATCVNGWKEQQRSLL